MGRLAKFGLSLVLSAWGGASFGQSVLPNSGLNSNGASTAQSNTSNANSPSEEVIEVFRDPRSGREMERVRIRESVPQLSYQWKPAKETRMVPQWVTETRKTTQYRYTPVNQYQLQTRWIGRYNPFVQPTMSSQYVPVTSWQPTPVVVDVPVQYQKWTPQEQTVMIRELVDNPRVVVREVVRYRGSSSNSNVTSPSGYASNSIDPRATYAQTAANEALARRAAPFPNNSTSSGNYGLSPMTMDLRTGAQPMLAQSTVPLGAVGPAPLVDPGRWIASVNSSSSSWNGSRPLFQNTVFQSSPSPSYGQYPGTNFAGSPLSPAPGNSMNQYASSSMGNSTLRPSTWNPYARQTLPQMASIPGSTVYRDPTQTGLRATEIR